MSESVLPDALCLTRDHNPVDYEERQRIQATGATVQNGRINNVLEVSRSFGDYQFKKQGVTCIPDVRKCQLTSNDKFLLIACDGLWKSFPPSEAVKMVDQLLQKEVSSALLERESLRKIQIGSPNTADSDCLLTQRRVEAVCTQIVNEAVLRMSGDNVTCILIVFPDSYGAHLSSSPITTEAGASATSSTGPAATKRLSNSSVKQSDAIEPPTKLSRSE
ncbi:unnamed protein product [Echinostoma caproni]|uniref:PPM-type phosphatase domain-containing protein n=1 Tax=Echinostoma caproni TaxID=27848 RepID=A0A183AWA5_9TREM|nr:unnamed protein product [Echinostoma caproni]